jgi:hypothetical protein
MATRRTADIDIFISHSHKDKRIAEAIVQFLTSGVGVDPNDIRCTSFAPTGLAIGARIADQLRKDIENCSFFMPLITQNSAGSEYVAFEIGAAWALETTITPLVLATEELRMPALLQGHVYCDLKNIESLVQLASELSKELFYANDRRSANHMLAAARGFLVTADA